MSASWQTIRRYRRSLRILCPQQTSRGDIAANLDELTVFESQLDLLNSNGYDFYVITLATENEIRVNLDNPGFKRSRLKYITDPKRNFARRLNQIT